MASSSSTTKGTSRPCGCGGSSGHAKSSSCSCGGSYGCGCSTCKTEGYSRPRFFAGQLLTEDDLQQLGDYVVAKNRLHASHLFGAGVVCGLEVTCFPCGGGKVVVNPGYALDCCGNDIVLGCSEELDINQMVRELQRKMRGGFDCGDPCADAQRTSGEGSTSSENTVAPVSVVRGEGDPNTQVQPKTGARHREYCLYVNYCEQPSDLVSPYAADDPCTPQTCETTRIREGFRFELRCPDDSEMTPTICSRYKDCIGDPVASTKSQNDSRFFESYERKVAVGLAAVVKNPALPAFDKDQFRQQLSRHVASLNQVFEEPAKRAQTTAPLDPQALVDAAVAVASDIARYSFHSESAGDQASRTDEEQKPLADAIRNAQDLLKRSLKTLQPMLEGTSPAPFETQVAKDYAASVADLVTKISASPTGPQGVIPETTRRLLADGIVATQPFYDSAAGSLQALRAYLVSRLEQEAMKTHCLMLDSVLEVPEPSLAYNEDLGLTRMRTLARSSNVYANTLLRLVQACFCDALNPPCPSCDDMGVLLACITIEDCRVKDICNLDRQFVLSPVAIRYWIPEITRIGRAIEKACCPDPCESERRQIEPSDVVRTDPDVALARTLELLLLASCRESAAPGATATTPVVTSTAGPFVRRSVADLLLRVFPRASAETMAPALAAEDSQTVSQLAAALKKVQADNAKLRADFGRLSDKFTRREKKVIKPHD